MTLYYKLALFLLLLLLVGSGDAELHGTMGHSHVDASGQFDAHRIHFGACLHEVIRITQDCKNKFIQYTPIMWLHGFGSQYQTSLNRAFQFAILTNRRMVFMKTTDMQAWEYDCEEKAAWGCYLTFGNCPDSIVSQENLAKGISNLEYDKIEWHNPLKPNSSILRGGFIFRDNPAFKMDFPRLFGALQTLGKVPKDSVCDINHISVSNITAITTKHLFVYNSKTKAAIVALNKKNYPSLFRDHHLSFRIEGHYPSNYVSLQLRTQDKKGEISQEQWDRMTDVAYIANFTLQHMHDHKHLFVATDNCSMIPNLRKLMSSTITIHSACDLEENPASTLNQRYFSVTTPNSKALSLLADVEMLRHGEEFIGLFESNLVRLVHLLRYPQNNRSHALAAEWTSSQGLQNMPIYNMDDLPYFG